MSKKQIEEALRANHKRRTQGAVDVGWDASKDTFEEELYQRVASTQQATLALKQHSEEVTAVIAWAMAAIPPKDFLGTFPHNPGYDCIVWLGFESEENEDKWYSVEHNEVLGRILGFGPDKPPADEVVQALSAFLTQQYEGLVWLRDKTAEYEDEMDLYSPREIRICWPIAHTVLEL